MTIKTTSSVPKSLLAVLMCTFVCSFSLNASDDVELVDESLTVEELGDKLFPKAKTRSLGKTRAIVINRKDPASTNESHSKAIAMLINFKFGKAEILSQSLKSLDTLGELLNHPDFMNESLVIEGHTDTLGSAAYNQKLSEQRANAVRRYLMSQHNVDDSRLLTVGKGELEPYDGNNSKAPINRRVQFKRL